MEMEKVLHMNAGLGDSSYAKNSSRFQRSGLEFVEPIMEDAILSMKMKMLMECKTVCIADLGCSSGPNALLPAENITKVLKAKYLSAGITVPQCQVFFNDLPASDFNSLLRSLPPFSLNTDLQNEEGVANRSYFAASVAGSFYGRLFPDKTLHFVHSSFSLHWLSQVPVDVSKKNSQAWNKGKIFCGGSRAVGEVYFHQFQRDFNTFLRARAEELVEGGRMVLVLIGRTTRDPSDQGFLAFYLEALESSLKEFLCQGLIEEEKVDSFNIPLYAPCPEEVSGEVEREGSFEILRLELQRKSERLTEKEMEVMRGSASAKAAVGKIAANSLRAVWESLLKHHFGEEIMDALFERHAEIIGKRYSESNMGYGEKGGYLVLVLERK